MNRYILLTNKPWHDSLYENLCKRTDETWIRLTKKSEFVRSTLETILPDKIFIPHWSHLISRDIYQDYECVLFHMTDLPYGRGGSPLQNLVLKKHLFTQMTAIRVTEEVDAGDFYLKIPLILGGTAEEIFIRSSKIVEEMIVKIIEEHPVLKPQEGEIVNFSRRGPADGNLLYANSLEQIHDYIRMLDCEGYPNAFLEFGDFRLEFSRSSLKSDNSILADVRIVTK